MRRRDILLFKFYIMEKFDYILLNEDNEWLSTGIQETQEQLEKEIELVRQREFDRWGEHLAIIVMRAPVIEISTTL